MQTTLDSKKIRKFLAGLTGPEFLFLQLQMQMVDALSSLIRRYKPERADLCEKLGIEPDKYFAYISGDYAYDMMDLAKINALHMEYASMKSESPVQFKDQAA